MTDPMQSETSGPRPGTPATLRFLGCETSLITDDANLADLAALMAEDLSLRFRKRASTDAAFRFDGMSIGELSALRDVDPPWLAARYCARSWTAKAFVCLSPGMGDAITEVMFASGATAMPKPGRRSSSTLTVLIAEQLFDIIAAGIGETLGQGQDLSFELEAVGDPGSLLLETEATAYLNLEFSLQPAGSETFRVSLPVPPLAGLAKTTAATSSGEEKGGLAEKWSAAFAAEIAAIELRLDAWIPAPKISLMELASLEVGTILPLDEGALDHVRIGAAGKPMLEGRLGKSKGALSIELTQRLADR